MHAAASAIALPPGCRPPPGPLGRRIAAGWGASARHAALLTTLEAAERYSIQFRTGDPDELEPWRSIGGPPRPSPAAALLLGHPRSPVNAQGGATSIGAAAGFDMEDAALRATLEQIEHAARSAWLAGALEAAPVRLLERSPLGRLAAALAQLGRRLAIYAMAPVPDVAAAVCVVCGHDGEDAALGSAAGRSLGETCLRAAAEATLLWCNLRAIVRRGAPLEGLTSADRKLLARYLEGWPLADLPRPGDLSPMGEAARNLGISARPRPKTLQELASSGAFACRIFDFTRPEVGVAVARSVLDRLELSSGRG